MYRIRICSSRLSILSERMPSLERPGRRPSGRTKRSFMDGVNEDMKVAAVKEEDAQNRLK